MAYRVRIESFEGPFDLLLYLVSRQKVDIGAISITEIADQYLAEVARMRSLDLDVASDFLVVASTLLEIKAQRLLPRKEEALDEDMRELTLDDARELLVERLVTYKQFKDAAAALAEREGATLRAHARTCGIEPAFMGLMPDFLAGVAPDDLARIAARVLSRRSVQLLESDHIAARPLSLARSIRSLYDDLRLRRIVRLSEVLAGRESAPLLVVSFLAVLELYKRGIADVSQPEAFGDIEMRLRDDAPELVLEDDGELDGDQQDDEREDDQDNAGAGQAKRAAASEEVPA